MQKNKSFLKNKMHIFRYIIFILLTLAPLHVIYAHQGTDFYALTIPKSGTHLLTKMLMMLTEDAYVFGHCPPLGPFRFEDEGHENAVDDREVERYMALWKKNHLFPIAHFNSAPAYDRFSLRHPEYKKIALIRDLRDVIVSCAFMQGPEIEKEIGPCSFEKKIHYLIALGEADIPKNPLLNIYRNAKIAAVWIQDPSVFICRFEDLIGPQGNGDASAQNGLIASLASHIEINLTSEKLSYIIERLFGTDTGPQFPSSFREGKIGTWKKYFDSSHIEAFHRCMGEVQEALGYPL